MNAARVVMEGVLRSDGTLEMAAISTLPVGPVRVTVQPLGENIPPSRDPIDVLAEIRRMQEETGYKGRTLEEMLRDEQEERADDEAYEARWRGIEAQTGRPSDPRYSR